MTISKNSIGVVPLSGCPKMINIPPSAPPGEIAPEQRIPMIPLVFLWYTKGMPKESLEFQRNTKGMLLE